MSEKKAEDTTKLPPNTIEEKSSTTENDNRFMNVNIEEIFKRENYEGVSNKIFNKTLGFSIVGTAIGVSRSYYIGGNAPLYFYLYGVSSFVMFGAYFTGVEALKYVRKTEDEITYMAPAVVEGLLISALSRGAIKVWKGVALGAVFGATYCVGGSLLYSLTRNMYLDYKLYLRESLKRAQAKKEAQEALPEPVRKQSVPSVNTWKVVSEANYGFFSVQGLEDPRFSQYPRKPPRNIFGFRPSSPTESKEPEAKSTEPESKPPESK